MPAFMSISGNYYEGDKVSVGDIPCAKMPAGYVFTGTVSANPAVMWRPKTAGEIDNERAALAAAMADGDAVARATFLMLFEHENRIRSLEGRPIISKLQYAVGVRDIYKSVL